MEGGSYENQFIRDVIALHDKYLEYVVESFNNGSLFHKSLKEAFEAFCNRPIGTSTMAELMATFCDNLLKKVNARKTLSLGFTESLALLFSANPHPIWSRAHVFIGVCRTLSLLRCILSG